jgi:DNA polymerase V
MRPELNTKPVVVLSNNDGCAISRTPEAKALGIKMGAPLFEIQDLCKKKNVSLFSSNFSIYTNISNRVMNIIKEMSPHTDVTQ